MRTPVPSSASGFSTLRGPMGEVGRCVPLDMVRWLLLASAKPLTSSQIAAELEKARPESWFSNVEVESALSTRPDLFTARRGGIFRLGQRSWKLTPGGVTTTELESGSGSGAASAQPAISPPSTLANHRHPEPLSPRTTGRDDARSAFEIALERAEKLAASGTTASPAPPSRTPRRPTPPSTAARRSAASPPPKRAAASRSQSELIDDDAPSTTTEGRQTLEQVALQRERERRRAQARKVGKSKSSAVNYRDVIDLKHPITRVSDETLGRLGPSTRYIDSD